VRIARGRREEVVQGETGILVGVKQPDELAQALDALASNPAARIKLGKAGREWALDLYDETKVVARQIKTLGLEKKLF
jgi:glycosyltransferase involved in cell wall biosynthesis